MWVLAGAGATDRSAKSETNGRAWLCKASGKGPVAPIDMMGTVKGSWARVPGFIGRLT